MCFGVYIPSQEVFGCKGIDDDLHDLSNPFRCIHPKKTNMTMENNHLKMYLLFQKVTFHCHVTFLEGTSFVEIP